MASVSMLDLDPLHLLQQEGIYVPPAPVLTPTQVFEFRAYLSGVTVYRHHIAGKAQETAPNFATAWKQGWPVISPRMEDVLKAPHFFEMALAYESLARSYFRQRPRMYSVSAFWTTPSDGPLYGDTQTWHRDQDDKHQMTLFMLGSDVPDPSEGAHLYQKGTHRIADSELGRDPPSPPPCGIVTAVWGPAGTLVIADTWGLHKAIRPAKLPRLLVWARYAVANPPFTYVNDGLAPISKELLASRYPTDPELQEVVRLVVA